MSIVNIKSANKGYSSHKYNPLSVLSLDFGEAPVTRCIECIKGDNFTNVVGKGFLRLAPTIFPAYGRVKLNSAAFFVPESQIIQQSDAFHSNMSTYKGRAVVMPFFFAYEVNHMFAFNSIAVSSSVPFDPSNGSYLAYRIGDTASGAYIQGDSAFDCLYPMTDGSGNFYFGWYRLTKKGRVFYKLLKSLGYDFVSWEDSALSSITDALNLANFKVNALPLLSYLKIYCDMFLNPHLYNSSPLVAFLKSIHDCEDYQSGQSYYYTSSTGELTQAAIYFVCQNIRIPFSKNMYLDAWNSPNSPDGVIPSTVMIDATVPDGLLSPIIPQTSTMYIEKATVGVNSTFLSNISSSGNTTNMRYVSQYGLNWVDAFFKYVRRNNLFGSKAVERILARFGIKSSDYNTHTVNKIFEGSSDIDFSAVLSQTDSYNSVTDEGKTLGSYAGYGAAGLDFKFSHKCDSFGYIICLSWLSIIPIKPTGFDPRVLRIQPLDFYTPEWDGKTLRAIPMCEIGRSVSRIASNNNEKDIYGFTDIYDDYREQQDSVSGDFVLDDNVKDFMFSRDLGKYRRTNVSLKPQANDIQYYPYPNNSFSLSNPFQWQSYIADRFYLQINFDISAKRPILSKSSALDLNGEGDMSLNLGGSQMS